MIYDNIVVNIKRPNPTAQGHTINLLILKQLTPIQLNINIYFSRYALFLLKNEPISVFFIKKVFKYTFEKFTSLIYFLVIFLLII